MPEDVVHHADEQQVLIARVSGQVVVVQSCQQGLALAEQFAGAGVVAASRGELAQDALDGRGQDQAQFASRMAVQRQALLEQHLRPGLVLVGD